MSGDFKLRNIGILAQVIAKIKNWPTYLIDLFSLTKSKYVILNLRNGNDFLIRANTTDRGIVTTVAIQDEYQLGQLNLKNATIIDIGGQNGYFSVHAAKYASKVYTFEPFKENYVNILKNIELNNLNDTIIPFNCAVSKNQNGKKANSKNDKKLRIYLSQNTGGHSIYSDGNNKNFIDVNVTTLKEIFDKNKIEICNLLKIDAEGSEYDILYTLPEKYFDKILRIRMEVHQCDNKKNNSQALISFLKSKGYAVAYNTPLLFASRVK